MLRFCISSRFCLVFEGAIGGSLSWPLRQRYSAARLRVPSEALSLALVLGNSELLQKRLLSFFTLGCQLYASTCYFIKEIKIKAGFGDFVTIT